MCKRDFLNKIKQLNEWCVIGMGFIIPLSTTGTHVLLALFSISWLFSGDLKAQVSEMMNCMPLRIACLLFCVFLAGTLYSPAPMKDISVMLGKMNKLVYFPFLWSTMSRSPRRYWVLWAFVSAMVLTLSLALLQKYGGLMMKHPRNFGGFAVFKDHIFTNLMMAFAAFILGHQAVVNTKILWRFLLCALMALMIYYGFFITGSRTGYVIFIVLWSVFCIQRRQQQSLGFGLIVLVALLGFTFSYSPAAQRRVLDLKSIGSIEKPLIRIKDFSFNERLSFLKNTWALSKTHPWFGFGTGSLKTVYQAAAIDNGWSVTSNPHNEYLNIFFQLGLCGLSIFLWFFYAVYKESLALLRMDRHLVQGLLMTMILGCAINSWFMDFTSGYFFIVLMAVLLSRQRSNHRVNHQEGSEYAA